MYILNVNGVKSWMKKKRLSLLLTMMVSFYPFANLNPAFAQDHTSTNQITTAKQTAHSFEGKMNPYRYHVYRLHVAEAGTVQVKVKDGNRQVSYTIAPMNPEDEEVYQDGDWVPEGDYELFVFVQQDGKKQIDEDFLYRLELKGIHLTDVDQTVPSIKVATPHTHEFTWSKKQNEILIKGAVTGASEAYIQSDQGQELISGKFAKRIPLIPGFNLIQIAAYEKSGNYVVEDFYIEKPLE